MASIQIQVRSGQEIVAPVQETELQFPTTATRVLYFVTTGTVQVAVGRKNTSGDVIGGLIHAFGTSDGHIETRLNPGDGTAGDGQALYVKGAGTIVVTYT